MDEETIKNAIESLIKKGYLKQYPNNEIGLTKKGKKLSKKIKKEDLNNE